MSAKAVIVVGASAGGVGALSSLVAGFPEGLQAAVVVLYIGNEASSLPAVLSASGPLPACYPHDGQAMDAGVVYVVPPDHHVCFDRPDQMTLSRGPKEHGTRPAINPAFRSVAEAYGSRAIGVILTGISDDGVAGLEEIKRRGGIAVVQDPKTAAFPSMPYNAIEQVAVDYVLPLHGMAEVLTMLVQNPSPPAVDPDKRVEQERTDLTCPECRGPISEYRLGNLHEFRCRVGHAYSMLSFAEQHRQTVERKLWEAVVALEESAEVAERLALQFGGNYKQQAKDRREQASVMKELLTETMREQLVGR